MNKLPSGSSLTGNSYAFTETKICRKCGIEFQGTQNRRICNQCRDTPRVRKRRFRWEVIVSGLKNGSSFMERKYQGNSEKKSNWAFDIAVEHSRIISHYDVTILKNREIVRMFDYEKDWVERYREELNKANAEKKHQT